MAAERKRTPKRQDRITEVDEVALRLRVEGIEDRRFLATSPDLPGLVAEGRSITEAVEIAQGLSRKIVESCLEHGDPLPPIFAKARREFHDFIVPVSVR